MTSGSHIHKGIESTLNALLRVTAPVTGKEFFRVLVRELCQLLHVKGAWITRYEGNGRSLKAEAFWLDNVFVDSYEYLIKGTPCEPVIHKKKLTCIRENVIQLFPDDPDLPAMHAVGYLGIPLLDSDNALLGHLALLDDKSLPDDPLMIDLFRIFADRATAEIRRLKAAQSLEIERNRLRSLFEATIDAIVILDRKGHVVEYNRSAGILLDINTEDHLLFDRLVHPDCRTAFNRHLRQLDDLQQEVRCSWLPGGIILKGKNGRPIHAEGTGSRFVANNNVYYSLVLRNVNDRLEAERRIEKLESQAEFLRLELEEVQPKDTIVTNNKAMQNIMTQVGRIASRPTSVLITGESGTGKEVLARTIHRASDRAEKPMISINCAAIPVNLIESELFGHEKGAFTGATSRRPGRFALADGGTIFLDEIGELALELQPKLLRVLQEGVFEAVGSNKTTHVDVRIISATNRDLSNMVAEGKFREDLYYRLNVYPLHLPPLRERKEDIFDLAGFFIAALCKAHHTGPITLTDACKRILLSYDWPGNIRELRNVIERAVITAENGKPNWFFAMPGSGVEQTGTPDNVENDDSSPRIYTLAELKQLERQNIIRAIEHTRGKISGKGGAAEMLGMKATTLSSRIRALDIQQPSRS